MNDYLAWAYKQQLERKYQNELSNPVADQARVAEIKKAIEEKTQEFVQQQQIRHRQNIDNLKREMP